MTIDLRKFNIQIDPIRDPAHSYHNSDTPGHQVGIGDNPGDDTDWTNDQPDDPESPPGTPGILIDIDEFDGRNSTRLAERGLAKILPTVIGAFDFFPLFNDASEQNEVFEFFLMQLQLKITSLMIVSKMLRNGEILSADNSDTLGLLYAENVTRSREILRQLVNLHSGFERFRDAIDIKNRAADIWDVDASTHQSTFQLFQDLNTIYGDLEVGDDYNFNSPETFTSYWKDFMWMNANAYLPASNTAIFVQTAMDVMWNIIQGNPDFSGVSYTSHNRHGWDPTTYSSFTCYSEYRNESGRPSLGDTFGMDGAAEETQSCPGLILRCCNEQFFDLVQTATSTLNWGLPPHNVSIFPDDGYGDYGVNVWGPFPRMSFSILNKAVGGHTDELSDNLIVSTLMFTLFNEAILSSKSDSQTDGLRALGGALNPVYSLPSYTNNLVGIEVENGTTSTMTAKRTTWDGSGWQLSLTNFLAQTIAPNLFEGGGPLNTVALEDEKSWGTVAGLATVMPNPTDSSSQIILAFETNASLSVAATGLAGDHTTSTFYTESPPESDYDSPEGRPSVHSSYGYTSRPLISGEEYAYLDMAEGSGLDHYQAAHETYKARVANFTDLIRALYQPQRSHDTYGDGVAGDQTRPYAILGTIAELFYWWLKDFENRSDYESSHDNELSAWTTGYDYPRWNFETTIMPIDMGDDTAVSGDGLGGGTGENNVSDWFRGAESTAQMMRNSASGGFELCMLAHAFEDQFVLNALIEWVVSKYKLDRHFGGSNDMSPNVNPNTIRVNSPTSVSRMYHRSAPYAAVAGISGGFRQSGQGRRYNNYLGDGRYMDTAPGASYGSDYIGAGTDYNLASMKLSAMIIRLIAESAGDKIGGSGGKRWTNKIRNYIEMAGTQNVEIMFSDEGETHGIFTPTLYDIHAEGGGVGHYIGEVWYHSSGHGPSDDMWGVIASGGLGTSFYDFPVDESWSATSTSHSYSGGLLHSPNWHPFSNPIMWYLDETFHSPDNIDPMSNYWEIDTEYLGSLGLGTIPSGDDLWSFTRTSPTLGSLARICLFLGRLGFTNTVTNLKSQNLPGTDGGEGMQLSLRTHDGGGETTSAELDSNPELSSGAVSEFELQHVWKQTWLSKANGIFDEQWVALGVILLVRCWGILFKPESSTGISDRVEMGFWISDSEDDYDDRDLGAFGLTMSEIESDIKYEWPSFQAMYGVSSPDDEPRVDTKLGRLIDSGEWVCDADFEFWADLLPYMDAIGMNPSDGESWLGEGGLGTGRLVYLPGFDRESEASLFSDAVYAPYSGPGAGGTFNYLNSDGPRALKMSMWWEDDAQLKNLISGLRKLIGREEIGSHYQPDSEGTASSKYAPSDTPGTKTRAYNLLSCWLNAMQPYKNIYLGTKFFNAMGVRIQNALDSVESIITSDIMTNLIFAEEIDPSVRGQNWVSPVHLVDNLTLESVLSSFNSFAPFTQQFSGWGSDSDEESKNITFPVAYATRPTDLTNFTALMKTPLFRGQTSETGIPVGERQRIIVVGLPIGFMDYMRSLAESCLGTKVLNATSLISLKINKVDMKNNTPGSSNFVPKQFLFDTRLFIKTADIPSDIFTRSFTWNNDERKINDWVTVDDSYIDFDIDFVTDVLEGGRVEFNFMDIPAFGYLESMIATRTYNYSDFSGTRYSSEAYGSAVSTDESIEIATNHVNDYYLKYYLSLAMGVDVSEMGFFFNEGQVALVQPGVYDLEDIVAGQYEFSPAQSSPGIPTFLEPTGGRMFPPVDLSVISTHLVDVGKSLSDALVAATTEHPFDPESEGIDPVDSAITERIQKMTAKASQFSSDYLMERITLPKIFERTFAVLIDVDDFELSSDLLEPPPSTSADFYAFSAEVEIFRVDSSPFSGYEEGAYDKLVTSYESS